MNILDPYGFMIPEIFPDGEADSPLNLVSSCPCEFWFDGQDEDTFDLNGANVITWADKSGFGRDVTNAVDARRPTYIPATGRVDFVKANSDYLQSAAFGPLVQPYTIFVLYKKIGVLNANEIIFNGRTLDVRLAQTLASQFNMYAGVNLSNDATNANDNIHVGEFNGATSNNWINGILNVNGNTGVNNLDGITLGMYLDLLSVPSDCEIMEVIGYNCMITTAERNAVTAYLNAKWSVY